MTRAFTTDRLLHFGSVLAVGAWTVGAFAALAELGTRPSPEISNSVVQFVSWLMPVIGVYGTWAFLRMPHTVVLTDTGELQFEAILGRRLFMASDVSRVKRDRLGWFMTFEIGNANVHMLSRISGLWTLLGAIKEKNASLEVNGF